MSFFAVDSIQDDVHSKNRLAILVYLSTVATVEFVRLQDEVRMRAGNLSQNLKKLEDNGYVQIQKTLVEGKPKTTVSLTRVGEAALNAYLVKLRSLIDRVPVGAAKPGQGIDSKRN